MNQYDIDEIFSLLENPTRRNILRLLSLETHYPLQLAHELGISQQAIGKHIRVLEDHGFIRSHEEPSDIGGPPRKVYVPTHRFSIRVDMGPGLFQTVYLERIQAEKKQDSTRLKNEPDDETGKVGSGENGDERGPEVSMNAEKVIAEKRSRGSVIGGGPRVGQIGENDPSMADENDQKIRNENDVGDKIEWMQKDASPSRNRPDPQLHLKQLTKDLGILKAELEVMESKRQEMVNRREELLCTARRIVGELVEDYNERKLVYYLLDRGPASVEDLSEIFDSRVKYILQLRQNIENSHGIDWLFTD